MASTDADKDAWIAKVLGVTVQRNAAPVPALGKAPAADAKPPAETGKPGGDEKKAAYETLLKSIEDRATAAEAAEVGRIRTECIEPAKKAATAATPDYEGATALLVKAGQRLDVIDLHKRRYEAGLKVAQGAYDEFVNSLTVVTGTWPGWGGAPIPGVSDVPPSVKTKDLDPGKAKAATGDYAGAMLLLDAGTVELGDAHKKMMAFYDYANTRKLAGTTYDATVAGANPQMTAALATIKADTLDKGDALARAGDFAGAVAAITPAGPRMTPLVEIAEKRNTMISAINGLTAPAMATDKARLQTERLAPADAMAAAGNAQGARDLYVKGAEDADHVSGYAVMVGQAEEALAKLSQPAVAPDVARLRTDYVQAARKLADGWDYQGAAALLGKLMSEAATVGKLATTQHDAEAASQAAQDKGAHNPAAGVAEVKKLVTELEKHPNAAAIATQLATIHTDLAAAEKLHKADEVSAALDKVGKEIVDARMQAERAGQAASELEAAKTRIGELAASVATEKARIETTLLQPAEAKLAAGDRAGALALLAQIAPACTAAESLADGADAYNKALPKAQAAVAGLTDAFVAADRDAIKTTMLDPAIAKAAARDFNAASTLIDGVEPACTTVGAIAAANGEYQTALTGLNAALTSAQKMIDGATAAHLPARPDFAARMTEVRTQHLTPAAAKVSGRGQGAVALSAMQEAVALVAAGRQKAQSLYMDTYSYWAANGRAQAAKTAVDTLKAHPSHAAIDSEIAKVVAQLADGNAMLAAGQTTVATQTFNAVVWQAGETGKLADAAGGYATALAAAQQRMEACKSAVAAQAPTPPVVGALRAAEAETLTAAIAKAAIHDFAAAAPLLAQVAPRCVAVEAMAAQNAKFAADLVPVEAALAKLNQPAVAEDVKRIRAERVEPAKAAAATGDFKTATDLLAKAAAEAAQAGQVASGAQEAQAGRDGAQAAIDGGDVSAAAAAVQKQLDALLAHPQAAAIKDMTDKVAATLTAVKKVPAPADAKKQLTDAADLCVKARNAADRVANYGQEVTAVQALVNALNGPVVAAEKARIQKERLDAAAALVVPAKRDFAGALALLDKARTECAAAQALVTQDTAYQAALTAAQGALNALGAITPTLDPAVGADAQKIQTGSIDQAKTLAAAHDYDGAMKLLGTVAPACKSLALKKQMGAAAPIAPADAKARMAEIMAQPGGAKQLDDMVASLPDSTKIEVMQAALEARFGISSFKSLTEDGAATGDGRSGAKSLKKIYALMAKVPQKNVQGNPSLKGVDLFGGDAGDKANAARGSFYDPTNKKIVLSCGRAEDTNPQPLANTPLALPNVEPDCEMVPDSEVPVPKYFDWTTLHEVGHAIDDMTHFMDRRMGNPTFGNWQVHGGDVAPVARAIAKQTKLAGPEGEAYLMAYLSGAKAPAPAAPSGRADWADALKAGQEWCDAIRVGKELWETGSGSSGRAIDGRVYHEAYGGTWVSYDLAARGKGITGYQFRAPGEWLSELYAAFHSKKLKPSHPAAAWLADL